MIQVHVDPTIGNRRRRTCDPIAEDEAPPSADDKASRLPRQKTTRSTGEAGLAQPEQEKRPAEGASRSLVNKSTAAASR